MKVYLNRKNGIAAVGEFNKSDKSLVVKKGSTISTSISTSEKFRGTATIEKYRKEYVDGNTVKKDVPFKSASTAANFVTGISANGLIAWKNKDGKTIKMIMSEVDADE